MRDRMKLLSGLVLILAGSAQGATTLKPNITPGVSYAFDNTMKLDLNLGLMAGGQQMNVQQTIAQSSAGTVEVLEAAGGKISKAKITFAPSCGASVTMMGQQQNKAFALAGKTVTATLNGKLVDVVPADGVDEESRKAIADLITGEDGIYPTKAVNVGDEWSGSLGNGEMKSAMKFKLERISNVNGREVAELTTTGQISGVENGMNMNGTVAGPVVMDVLTGIVASGQVGGDLKIDGNMTEAGQQIVVNGTGKMSVGTKTVISGTTVTPPPVITPPAVDGPVTLAGLYAGDGLTLNVTGDDVKIELGTNQFGGKIAQRNGANLAGTFTHNGKAFDFKCVVNGDAVDFITGSKTYKLKKQGAANPLG